MKKFALFAFATAFIISSCSQSSDLVNDLPTPSKEQKEEKTPISFDTYNAKSSVVRSSRAGYAGDMTTAMLQKEGFGVIAYYTASTDFSSWSIEAPNFMYNTKVSIAGANGTDPSSDPWTYSPTVYWPNGNVIADIAGATGATGAGGGKLSFFAYAPYTAVTPNTGVATGDATTGIKGLSSNAATTAPSVSYSLAGGVDLLWGTAGTNGVTVNDAAQAGTTLTNGKAPVNVDLTKMKTNGKVNFLFKHALARVGSIKVVADVDAVTGGSLSNDSRIYVGLVSIENGMTTAETPVSTLIGDGSLDLTTGLWTAGSTKFSLSKSIASSAIPVSGAAAMNTAIEVPNTNPEAVGTKTWEQIFTTAGVTTTATSIYSSSVDPILLIPGADQTLKVSISYWVTSKDSNLSRGYTWVPQTVTKTISLGTLEMNKSYSLTLHLGLNSVKFTASVSDWDDAVSSQRVDLPVNVVEE